MTRAPPAAGVYDARSNYRRHALSAMESTLETRRLRWLRWPADSPLSLYPSSLPPVKRSRRRDRAIAMQRGRTSAVTSLSGRRKRPMNTSFVQNAYPWMFGDIRFRDNRVSRKYPINIPVVSLRAFRNAEISKYIWKIFIWNGNSITRVSSDIPISGLLEISYYTIFVFEKCRRNVTSGY